MYKKQVLNFNDPSTLRRFDGTDTATVVDTVSPSPQAVASAYTFGQLLAGGPLGRRPGVTVGSWFLSAELLVLSASLLVSILSLRRLHR